MAKSSRLPRLNPIRFSQANDTLPENYNTWPTDRGFFYQQIRSYQDKNLYQQPFNFKDLLSIYLDTLAPEVDIHIIDDKGNALAGPIAWSPATVQPGNTVEVGGLTFVYNTFYIQNKLSDLYNMTAFEQTVYVVLECVYDSPGDANSIYYVSEPLYIRKDGWADTMLIEATHPVNEFDVFFEQTSAIFGYRVKCDVTDNIAPTSEETVFEDQLYQMKVLDSAPIWPFNLIIGGSEGVPAYVLDKVNRALSCQNFRIDGTQYTKDKGATFSITTADNDPLKGASIQLREYNLANQGQFTEVDVILLQQIYGVTSSVLIYPFAMNKIELVNFGIIRFTGPIIIEDGAALTALLVQLNTGFAPTNGLRGTFSVVGQWLIYTPAVGENYAPGNGMYCYSTFFDLEFTRVGLPPAFDINWRAPAGGSSNLIVDWGDTNQQIYTTGGTTSTISYNWPTPSAVGTKYSVRFFHAGTAGGPTDGIVFLQFASASAQTKVTKILGGDLPATLQVWNMANQSLTSSAVDFTLLEAACANLTYVGFGNCGIGSAGGATGVLNLFQTVGGWTALKNLYLNLNYFTTLQLNPMINRMNTNMTPINPGGNFFIKQTVPAVISGSQLAYCNILATIYGWTVSHD